MCRETEQVSKTVRERAPYVRQPGRLLYEQSESPKMDPKLWSSNDERRSSRT